eukprot:gene5524-5614_t
MAGAEPDAKIYSPMIGFAFMFNLIVGAGALSMPEAFSSAGWLTGTFMLSLLALLSWMSATFVVEAMSIANAVLKTGSKSVDGKKPVIAEKQRRTIDMLQMRTGANDYELDLQCELAFMANLFFTAWERKLFYLTLVSLVTVPRVRGGCIGGLEYATAYRAYLALFIAIIGPFTLFDVSKTKMLQLSTIFMRWASFIVMILIAAIGILQHRGFNRFENKTVPVENVAVSNMAGLPQLFGVSIYSYMPSLLTPVSDKTSIRWLLTAVITLTLAFYLLLSFTAMFRFTPEELAATAGLYTLNFADYHVHTVSRALEFFPVFVLSANFPIIAITLRNNLKTLFPIRSLSEEKLQIFYASMTVMPPVTVYVIPALLVLRARGMEANLMAKGISKVHASIVRKRGRDGILLTVLSSTNPVRVKTSSKPSQSVAVWEKDGVEATATAAAVGAEAGGGVESVASANELKAMLSTKIDERETLKLQLADKRGGATELKKAKEIDKTISEIDVISGDMYDENATELKKAKRKGLPTVTLTNRAGQLGLEIDQLLGLSPGNHNMKRRKSTSPQKLQRTSATFEVDMVLSSSSVGHIGGGGSAKPGKSFATSNFKKAYMKAKPILFQDELFSEYCRILSIPQSASTSFFVGLQAEAFEHTTEVQGVNALLVTARDSDASDHFPDKGVVFRGAVIPVHLVDSFFTPEKKYRVPGFLATTFNLDIAHVFCERAYKASQSAGMDSAAVIWVVHVDKRGASNQRYRNRNASLIRKSQVEGEEEYLFVPYSVFTVTKVVRGESSGFSRPFEIHVQAALDNALEPQDLIMAPWY